jgi:hypothetical protein
MTVLFNTEVSANAAAKLTVSAGELDRAESVVTFRWPNSAAGAQQLKSRDGMLIPVQMDTAGQASFILPNLAKGATAEFEVVAAAAQPNDTVKYQRDGTRLNSTLGAKQVFSYQAEPGELPRSNIRPIFQRGGYIHPVFSPGGLLVTDDYPADHAHHHGIWFPWTKTEFEGRAPDFWNMGTGSARVEFAALDRFWSGPVHGGFVARHKFVDLTSGQPKVALNEVWEVRLYAINRASRPMWVFDFVSTQECATEAPLKLPKYHYGGLGFRGSAEWIGRDKQPYLTSEGITDKLKGNESRGRWCYIGGPVKGQQTGVAILDHPQNFRAPQPMRLNPDQPFFCYAPSQLGEWMIEPGKPYVSRYRFVVFDGPPDAAEIDRLWNDYAKPVGVTIR